MTVTVLTPLNLNERVYDELRTRVLTRQEPSGAVNQQAIARDLQLDTKRAQARHDGGRAGRRHGVRPPDRGCSRSPSAR